MREEQIAAQADNVVDWLLRYVPKDEEREAFYKRLNQLMCPHCFRELNENEACLCACDD